jgi:hypothetical protein
MWQLLVDDYFGMDTSVRLALGRVNVALYAAYGGLDTLFDHVFKTGDQERIRKARHVAASGDTFFHPLRLAVLTNGEYDDSVSLYERTLAELDRAEPRLRGLFTGLDPEPPMAPLLAGGLVRALFLRAGRKAGLPIARALVDTYGDADVWLWRHPETAWSEWATLLFRLFGQERGEVDTRWHNEVLRTAPAGGNWSDRPIQLILPFHGQSSPDLSSFIRLVLTTFDFTACQVGLGGRWWADDGALCMTPLFAYSILSGHMTQGRDRMRVVPFPFKFLGAGEPVGWSQPPRAVDPVDKARLLRRFFKYLALGYTYPELSAHELALQRRIFEGPDVQRDLAPVKAAQDSADYPFDLKHVFTLG